MMDILAELHMARLRDQNWDNHLDMLMELFWVLQLNTMKYNDGKLDESLDVVSLG